jgi:putative FmdB family regulatory protein
MPISVYRCQRCKERFELLVPMSENFATATCPNCGAADARKQISAFAAPQKGTSTATDQSCTPTGG